MKNTFKILAAATLALVLMALPATAQIGGRAITAVSMASMNSGTVSNIMTTIDTSKGDNLFVEFAYNNKTNYAVNSSFATALTNAILVMQPGTGSDTNAFASPGAFAGENIWNNAWTLKLSGMAAGVRVYGYTNITLNAVPAVRIMYITNTCGTDAACILTNVTVRYWVK